jgi:PAS domain S-box-containing protein
MKPVTFTTLDEALENPFFASSPDGIVVVDRDGAIVAANGRIAEILGHSTAELRGQKVEVLIASPLRASHRSHMGSYSSGPHIRAMGTGPRLKALHKSGEEIPVDISLSPFEAGGAIYTIAAIRDARLRLQAEEAIFQAEEWRAIIDDRQRIARDLHDTIIQDIFAAGMGLQALQRSMPSDDVLKQQLGDSVDHLDSVITRLRKVIFNLTHGDDPEPIDAATRRVVADSLNGSAINPTITVSPVNWPLPARPQEHVLATLQEALSNVVRHARATWVEVIIEVADEVCRLCVTDNGIGMPDAAATRPGFGLTNMMNRAQVLGGSCEITPREGGGTIVDWKVPI